MMTPEERAAFLSVPRTAVLATTGPGGRPHAVPVWFLWRDGMIRVLTERGSQKHRNAARTGRAALCVEDREGGSFRYLTAEGPVEVLDAVTPEDRMALWTHYRGEEAARAIVSRGGHESMVALIIRPDRWLG
ncbi:MAG: PPOX class F420-dependent oxidoreductase [Chloroflexi bacterium]|nr:PPOX class F420-dependent oxidoreductase [Chloroflexota bacterium]